MYDHRNEKAPGFKLLSDSSQALLIRLRDSVAPILDNNLLHHFTDHSVNHSDHVCEIIDKLISPASETDKRLNDSELVAVYAAAYLHDVGMHYEKAGSTETIARLKIDTPWAELAEPTRRDIVRRCHPIMSAELVKQNARTVDPPPIGLRLTNDYFPNEVACLCEAHGFRSCFCYIRTSPIRPKHANEVAGSDITARRHSR